MKGNGVVESKSSTSTVPTPADVGSEFVVFPSKSLDKLKEAFAGLDLCFKQDTYEQLQISRSSSGQHSSSGTGAGTGTGAQDTSQQKFPAQRAHPRAILTRIKGMLENIMQGRSQSLVAWICCWQGCNSVVIGWLQGSLQRQQLRPPTIITAIRIMVHTNGALSCCIRRSWIVPLKVLTDIDKPSRKLCYSAYVGCLHLEWTSNIAIMWSDIEF